MSIFKGWLVLLFAFFIQINLFAQREKHVDSLLQLYVQNNARAIVLQEYTNLSIKDRKFFKKYSYWKSRDRKPDFTFLVKIPSVSYLMYYSYFGIAHGYRLVIVTHKNECVDLDVFFEKGVNIDSFFENRLIWNASKCCSNK